MTKQLHKLFLPALALLLAVGSYAQDAEINGIYYNLNKTAQTASVTYRGSWSLDFPDEYTGDLVIPASVDYDGITYAVTSIGDFAIEGCSGLTSVTFPESVTTIGESAFSGCDGLPSVDIPATVTRIGDGAFAACLGLESINVSSDNPIYCSIDGILYSKDETV